MISGVRRNDPITLCPSPLGPNHLAHWVQDRRDRLSLFDWNHSTVPKWWRHDFTTPPATHVLLPISFIPRSNIKGLGDRALSIAAPRVWNSLPTELRLLAVYPFSTTFSLTLFRSRLKSKSQLFRLAFPDWVHKFFLLSMPIAPLIIFRKRCYSISNSIHYYY